MVRYQDVRHGILARIRGGEWPPGHRIPSENALAATFGVSRMTADRAVRELVREGEVIRTPRVGSFVARRRNLSITLQIRDIADHVQHRGKTYSAQLISLSEEPAAPAVAEEFGIRCGAPVFHSVMVHFEDFLAVQLEERFIHPKAAPDYIRQTFDEQTPSAYLRRLGKVQKVDCRIEAITPSVKEQRLLGVTAGEACLSICERALVNDISASIVRFVSPASRFHLDAVQSFGL